ncbi:kinase-like domain-containing protein [Aspergillus californicus]
MIRTRMDVSGSVMKVGDVKRGPVNSLLRPRLINRVKRTFSLHAKPIQFPPSQVAFPIPQHEFVDEETCPAYNSKYFYLAKPREILANHYQLLPERFVALKIINSRSSPEAYHERDIEEHISRQSPIHRGRGIIRTCRDSFEVTGPDGSHLCLAYEPMREPLWILQKRFACLLILLVGLNYLHSECRLVHTDLKLDNVLMTFENEDILPNFIKEQITNLPMQYKTDPTSGRTICRCHNDFGALDWRELRKMIPKIIDFGLATRLKNHYRAPEVILGCPWNFSADIWNIGVLAWNIIENTELFLQVHDSQGHYNPKTHLAEMIALPGPPPKELLAKSDAMAEYRWSNHVVNESGRLCRNGWEYFNGPFFNENGKFLHDDLIPARKLEDLIPSLEEKERQTFLSFITLMLAWNPERQANSSQVDGTPVPEWLK